jgi:hypothetical protein
MKFLLQIPRDVILLILEHCDPKALGRLRMTCKSLNDLFFTPSIWKYLRLESKAHQSFLIKLISKTRRGIRTVVASDISADLVREILKTDATDVRLLNLTEFSLYLIPSNVVQLDVHYLLHTRVNFSFMIGSKLTELHLLMDISTEFLIHLSDCLHLSCLTLGNCSGITNYDLLSFIKRDKKWRYLALLGARNINDLALQEMSIPDIQNLVLHSCGLITDSGIVDLAQSKSLQWIKVIACRGLSLGAFDNTKFEGTLECFMKYSGFVNGIGMSFERVM